VVALGRFPFRLQHSTGLLYDNWNQTKMEKEAGGQHTDYLSTHHFSLLNLWNAHKGGVAPWWEQNSSHVYNDGAKRASQAFTNFTKGRTRPPTFHKRGEHDSYRSRVGDGKTGFGNISRPAHSGEATTLLNAPLEVGE
jgi:hypothetical protein